MANEHVQELIGGMLNDAIERIHAEHRLRAILIAYERAKEDEHAKLPSYLMAALEAASR